MSKRLEMAVMIMCCCMGMCCRMLSMCCTKISEILPCLLPHSDGYIEMAV